MKDKSPVFELDLNKLYDTVKTTDLTFGYRIFPSNDEENYIRDKIDDIVYYNGDLVCIVSDDENSVTLKRAEKDEKYYPGIVTEFKLSKEEFYSCATEQLTDKARTYGIGEPER